MHGYLKVPAAQGELLKEFVLGCGDHHTELVFHSTYPGISGSLRGWPDNE